MSSGILRIEHIVILFCVLDMRLNFCLLTSSGRHSRRQDATSSHLLLNHLSLPPSTLKLHNETKVCWLLTSNIGQFCGIPMPWLRDHQSKSICESAFWIVRPMVRNIPERLKSRCSFQHIVLYTVFCYGL